MEQRTNSPYPRIDRPVLALVGVVLVIGTVLFIWSDRAKDWRYYQYEFRNMVAEQFGDDKAATVPSGLQQIWVADLERADRCTTCHQATNWKGFEQAEQPWRSHPAEPLRTHPVEKFGCTSCHGGQGWAIETEAAHGQVAHWEEPLLSRSLGEAYTLAGDKNALKAARLVKAGMKATGILPPASGTAAIQAAAAGGDEGEYLAAVLGACVDCYPAQAPVPIVVGCGADDGGDVTDHEIDALETVATSGAFEGVRWLASRLGWHSMSAPSSGFTRRDALMSGMQLYAPR